MQYPYMYPSWQLTTQQMTHLHFNLAWTSIATMTRTLQFTVQHKRRWSWADRRLLGMSRAQSHRWATKINASNLNDSELQILREILKGRMRHTEGMPEQKHTGWITYIIAIKNARYTAKQGWKVNVHKEVKNNSQRTTESNINNSQVMRQLTEQWSLNGEQYPHRGLGWIIQQLRWSLLLGFGWCSARCLKENCTIQQRQLSNSYSAQQERTPCRYDHKGFENQWTCIGFSVLHSPSKQWAKQVSVFPDEHRSIKTNANAESCLILCSSMTRTESAHVMDISYHLCKNFIIF